MKDGLYNQLDKSISEIRLLNLLPASSYESPLKGTLQTFALASLPSYECLSYACGKLESDYAITIEDNKLPITCNLNTALRHLRLEGTERVLWVDAVCIDRSSTLERSHQASLVKAIFSQCTCCLLWLGPQPIAGVTSAEVRRGEMERGLEVLRRIAERDPDTIKTMVQKWKALEEDRSNKLRTKMSRIRSERDPKVAPIMYMEEGDNFALECLLVFPSAWHRLWIMVELSLAPRVFLVVGRQTLNWQLISKLLVDNDYLDAFYIPSKYNTIRTVLGIILQKAQTIDDQRRVIADIRSGRGESKLLDVLRKFSLTRASDPRDKIFSALAVATDMAGFQISYNKTAEQVFSGATAWIINQAENLDIICQSRLNSFTHYQPNRAATLQDQLPSWTADFTIHNGNTLLFAQRDIFCAGRKTCKIPCEVVDNGLSLRARGVIIGQIGPIRQAEYKPTGIDTDVLWRWLKLSHVPRMWMKEYLGLDATSGPCVVDYSYVNGESICTAFWRTLVTDRRGFPLSRLTDSEIQATDPVARQFLLEDAEVDETGDPGNWLQDEGLTNVWMQTYAHWSFCMTTNGLFTMILPPTREGDIIACVDGAKVPLVLRRVVDNNKGEDRYKVLTVAYVHGFMDGEAMTSDVLRGDLGLEDKQFIFV